MGEAELRLEVHGRVAVLTMSRPPHNFFDVALLTEMADTLAKVDADPYLRVTVLASDQRSFCAGADFGTGKELDPALIYAQAVRLVSRKKPLVAAVGGPAIGGGLGLALVADFRVGSGGARFQANFVRIGISAGFGISLTLPRVVGAQKARDLLLTGRRVAAEEALKIDLLDHLVERHSLRDSALSLAQELAVNSPKAMAATRRLLGEDFVGLFRETVARELAFQRPLFASEDFTEGVRAAGERRTPAFADDFEGGSDPTTTR